MKTAIVGAGAMGSLFGTLLLEAGNEVWLYDVWQAHVDAIKGSGLQIEREGVRRSVRIEATTSPEEIGQNELVTPHIDLYVAPRYAPVPRDIKITSAAANEKWEFSNHRFTLVGLVG